MGRRKLDSTIKSEAKVILNERHEDRNLDAERGADSTLALLIQSKAKISRLGPGFSTSEIAEASESCYGTIHNHYKELAEKELVVLVQTVGYEGQGGSEKVALVDDIGLDRNEMDLSKLTADYATGKLNPSDATDAIKSRAKIVLGK